nr:serine/threonine-protein kinase [Bacteroides sp.]
MTLGNANTTELVVKLKEKFLKEAKNISKLNHPNIVAIHDIFEENGTAYYLMDFIDGTSLNDKIKFVGALPEEMALKYIRIVGNAITYMHSKKMNHLDIKPANIMLRKSDDAPILIDFGLAKQYDSTGDQTSTTPVGISYGYTPIEQYRPGGVATFTPQSDVYALGATLYALLTGQTPPHYSDILEEGLPVLPSSVSHATVTAIEKAMETKKTRRPSSIEEFLALLPDTIKDSKSQNLDNIQTDNSVSYKKTVDIQKANEEPVVKPIDKEKQKTEPKQKVLEETVILNVPLSNYIPTKEKNPHNEVAQKCQLTQGYSILI